MTDTAAPQAAAADGPLPATANGHSSSTPSSNNAEAARYSYARAILGDACFDKVASARLLVVGAGGIGCELLKNLVLVGFGNIEIVDLDTIDLSNLNRQFLFQKQHIKKPKSIVARQTANSFNPLVDIHAHHANIKEPRFGVAYFQRFDIVLNALDNLDARRWVNRMCIAANVPLVESGTTGFLGQVQPIQKDVTECYDCTAKPVPKTFPVCTIRSTPSTPIHCIVWAKSWLFTQLFGADDETEDDQELDKARREQLHRAARRVFDKVYKGDILRLLGMDEMWKHRPVKPVPLDYDAASKPVEGQPDGDAAADEGQKRAAAEKQTSLKDQRQLSLRENVEMFASSLASLAIRAAANPSDPLSFDKDDDDALDFVTAASNLRSHVYSIEQKTRFQVKEMAGNIIPAIASTNAIIAGVLVLQALHVLRARWQRESGGVAVGGSAAGEGSTPAPGVGAAKYVSLARTTQRMLTSIAPAPPNPECGVCRDVYVPLRLDASSVTLGQVLDGFVRRPRAQGGLGMADGDGDDGDGESALGLETYESARLLSDPDFDDNLGATLESLGVGAGKMLTVTDEEGVWQAVNLVIVPLREGETGLVVPQPGEVPELKKKVHPPPTAAAVKEDEEQTRVEDGEDDDVVEVLDVPLTTTTTARRKRGLEEVEADSSTPDVDDATKRKRADGDGARSTAADGDVVTGGSSKKVKVDAGDADVVKGSTEAEAIELD
ncbi:uncharacterized protein PFL1_01124 [Pseudozyma flocculosa PF-1]|uniref:uncharacterized protein n=1 Tax=Pseudozyma flocculosa PF-1 TaxID=1277687 RepID=UPI0004560487|nr:uncharacterized protein PFL1_01124 [Pseudozyma flocculosa PF-1]EPQ31792.1 hypothetical protein PFL1_01124 [Pseudozyma flocculosa PF-1]